MKKISFLIVVFVVLMTCSCWVVKASDDGAFIVNSEADLDDCLKSMNFCRLNSDIEVSNAKTVNEDLIIDLNGHILSPNSTFQLKGGIIAVNRGGKLTINDSKGTGKISSGSGDHVWSGVQLIRDKNSSGVAEIIVNGGTIEGYYHGIVGNGGVHNTKVTINGGVIRGLNKEDSIGIYQPQKGETIINGGLIEGGTGIEIRSGDLTINQGTVKGIAQEFVKMVNTNGTTTNGVGVSVAQHTTKNSIDVVIKDGNISGQYAFYEWNPHNNVQEDLDKIHLQISGGVFTGFATGVLAVYSQDFKHFISGGSFSTDVTEYLTNNAQVTSKSLNDSVSVFGEKNKKKNNIWLIFSLIVLGLIGLGIFWFYKNYFIHNKKMKS